MCNYESISIRCVKSQIFCMSEQYNLKNGSVWIRMVKVLLFFYSLFSLLSHHCILFFSPLSFFLIHSYQPLIFLFSFHSFFFLLSLLFSLPLSLTVPPPQLDADLCCCGFFFLGVIWWVGSEWVDSDCDGQIGCGGLRWMHSVVGWLLGQPIDGLWWWWANRWWWVLMCEFGGGWGGLWMGFDGWVGGGWVGSGNGWVCGMHWVVAVVFWFWWFFFFFLNYLFIRWCWWMWVCVDGGCRHCCWW